jgi:hypothetical protein
MMAKVAEGIVTVSCLIETLGLDAASTPMPRCPSSSRTA